MPTEIPEEKTMSVSAVRAAGALNFVFFSIPGLLFLLCGLVVFGWLETTSAAILVVGSLCLVMGYCCESVRYYKKLRMPRLSAQGYIMAWVYWGAVLLFVIQVLGVQKGFQTGLMCVLTILGATCIFINFMSVRGLLRQMELVVVQGVLHCLGGVMLMGGFFKELEMYVFVLHRDFLDGFPLALNKSLQWLFEHISVGGTIFFGGVLLAVAYALRLRLYSLRSGEKFREFIGKQTIVAVAVFILGTCFCLVSRQVLIRHHKEAIAQWETHSKEMQDKYGIADEFSVEARGFMLRQKDIGRLVVMLSDSLEEKDAPYAWANFNETMTVGSHEKLVRWYPEDTGADAEDRARLATYREALDAVWQSLDAAVEALPSAHDAAVTSGIFLLEEWRFLAALELGEYQRALEALEEFQKFGRQGLSCGHYEGMSIALRGLVQWCEMAAMMPAEYHDEMSKRAENLMAFVESLEEKKIIYTETRRHHGYVTNALDADGGLASQVLFFPVVEMFARMDDCRLLSELSRAENFGEIVVPRESMCCYTIFAGLRFKKCSEEQQVLLARLSQLL